MSDTPKLPPKLPSGISRDETQHGKLYYTRAQMLEYGRLCAEDAMQKIDASRMKSNASGQFKSSSVEDLMGIFGMKP